MAHSIEASAPGKVILMGEHAAVYGEPALVAAIGLRVRVELEPATSGVVLDLVDLAYQQACAWQEILDYRNGQLEEWLAYQEDRSSSFGSGRGSDGGHVVKVALGEVARSFTSGRARDLPPVRVRVRSELPVGAGFGSSAAVAVSVVAAALRMLEGRCDLNAVERLAMEVERRQHGDPSGIDHRTVLGGGIAFFSARDMQRALTVGDWVGESFALFDTGSPIESTGTVVASVRRRRECDEAFFDARLEAMGKNVVELGRMLSKPYPDSEGVRRTIEEFQGWLDELGVVPDSVQRSIERLREIGAAGKISGAGTLTGRGAGCLVVFRPPELAREVREALAAFRPIEAPIGADGLSVREVV